MGRDGDANVLTHLLYMFVLFAQSESFKGKIEERKSITTDDDGETCCPCCHVARCLSLQVLCLLMFLRDVSFSVTTVAMRVDSSTTDNNEEGDDEGGDDAVDRPTDEDTDEGLTIGISTIAFKPPPNRRLVGFFIAFACIQAL